MVYICLCQALRRSDLFRCFRASFRTISGLDWWFGIVIFSGQQIVTNGEVGGDTYDRTFNYWTSPVPLQQYKTTCVAVASNLTNIFGHTWRKSRPCITEKIVETNARFAKSYKIRFTKSELTKSRFVYFETSWNERTFCKIDQNHDFANRGG